jgi:CheY-like chemotaxis protein
MLGKEDEFMMNITAPPILAAEDEEADRLILELAFEEAKLPNRLIIVHNGKEVVDYLTGRPPYTDRAAYPLPALLLSDLKMPHMDGFDILEWLATRSEFKNLPVVIITSSSHEGDMEKARQLGARDFFVKPHTLSEYVCILHKLHLR